MRILHGESLISRNSLSLRGDARALAMVTSEAEIVQACAWARQNALPVLPLGQGSNIVVAGDIDALVMHLQTTGVHVLQENDESALLRVAAGEDWHSLVCWCLERGYHGLENLALIPGTVGAAPVQNIGAYGVELKSCLERVHAIDVATGEPLVLTRADCLLGYRDSIFKGQLRDRVVITDIELRLSRQGKVETHYPALAEYFANSAFGTITPREVFNAVVAIRRARLPDPATLPNAGSFFKNPVVPQSQAGELVTRFSDLPIYPQKAGRVKLPAAWLIERCGWKGHRENDLGVHPQHALVLVNYGNTTGGQILELAARIRASVRERFGIDLDIEPRVYGELQ